MCQELTIELGGLLHNLLFHQSVPPLPLAKLIDSMGSSQLFRQDGYSFVDHAENAAYMVDWTFLYQQMRQDNTQYHLSQARSGSAGGSAPGQTGWIDQRCRAYLGQEKHFLTKLFVAMHVMGGQPARGPELGSVKVRNSTMSPRNLYIINGRVAVVTTYDKSQKRCGRTRYVFRCLPDALSQITAQYLVYVLPFSRVVGKKTGDFLFADKRGPWDGDELSAAVAVATTKHLGVRLTVSSWRQVAIAIGDEHLRRASRMWRQDKDGDEEGVAVAEEEDDASNEQSLFEHILVRQSAHSSWAAHNSYAIDGAFLSQLGPDLINVYSQASRAWHAFLHLESKGAAVAVAIAKRPASPPLQPTKRPKLGVSVAMQGLWKILGHNAQPKSEGQAHALELVHSATPPKPQIIVLGTGSGKSLLFFSVAAMVSH